MRVAILFSGRGSNLKSVIEYSKNIDSINIVCTVTDNPTAEGISYPFSAGIPTIILPDRKTSSSFKEWESIITSVLSKYDVELVVLAGFMIVLHDDFCSHWMGRCINIHPSLLPRFPGLNTHQRALESGDSLHGCTVHWVTREVDGGEIISQAMVEIFPQDTIASLAEKVLACEHQLLPGVVRAICEGDLAFETNHQDSIPHIQV